MSQSTLRFFLPVLLVSLGILKIPGNPGQLLAQEDHVYEIGGSDSPPLEGSDILHELGTLDTNLDLSGQYTSFTGEDMSDSYGGLPVIAVGFSFQTSSKVRTFLSLGYGENTGDSYYSLPGFSAEDNIKVRYVPLQLGMKVDLAQSRRIHVFAGAALEIAWMEETIPLLDDSGSVVNKSASGINSGFILTFGPEIVLGQGGRAVGLEIGWGGSKGTVSTEGHKHDIDLTGYRGRLYLALDL